MFQAQTIYVNVIGLFIIICLSLLSDAKEFGKCFLRLMIDSVIGY